MNTQLKEFEDIVPSDFKVSPVWEFALDRETEGSALVRPVSDVPASTLANRLVGTMVRLANGSILPALIMNVTEDDPRKTRQFVSIALYKGRWRGLARYHDVSAARNGPPALAAFLGLPISDVFPIAYDLRAFCLGHPAALAGEIHAEPVERLSDDELRALALS